MTEIIWRLKTKPTKIDYSDYSKLSYFDRIQKIKEYCQSQGGKIKNYHSILNAEYCVFDNGIEKPARDFYYENLKENKPWQNFQDKGKNFIIQYPQGWIKERNELDYLNKIVLALVLMNLLQEDIFGVFVFFLMKEIL